MIQFRQLRTHCPKRKRQLKIPLDEASSARWRVSCICASLNEPLRIVVVALDLTIKDPDDEHAMSQAELSRSLRIGLLTNGFNLIASPPADVFLTERLTQLRKATMDVGICRVKRPHGDRRTVLKATIQAESACSQHIYCTSDEL